MDKNQPPTLIRELETEGIRVRGAWTGECDAVLTPEALRFVAGLERNFAPTRTELLAKRQARQMDFDAGRLPSFLAETREIRESDWRVAPIPADLARRRVEITGPADRKMIVNALNSGADVFMADFEDANSPTWQNMISGQLNVRDAARRAIDFRSPEGKDYRLNETTATLVVRPRGWHLDEKHLEIDGRPVSASIFDFGLCFFHNARILIQNKTGPYYYLPKIESHNEARLWNDVFVQAQDRLGIPRGTVRATVLIETLPAAFEMDEILYELKDHSSGLNCGRWDFIFSFIKKLRNHAAFVLPDRAQVTMDRAFLKAYVELLIKTCHRRGIHAMGGMAAQIPIKHDPAANEAALEKVRQDKLREVRAGHDGTWVAHPGLVPVALEIFDRHMKGPNQLGVARAGVEVTPKELLSVPEGTITEKGLRTNIDIGIQYLEAWLKGSGCVPIYHLMEDAATAEISRSQVWQWIRHRAKTSDGLFVDAERVAKIVREAGAPTEATSIFLEMMTAKDFTEFLTLAAYPRLD
jgi:malate synthase